MGQRAWLHPRSPAPPAPPARPHTPPAGRCTTACPTAPTRRSPTGPCACWSTGRWCRWAGGLMCLPPQVPLCPHMVGCRPAWTLAVPPLPFPRPSHSAGHPRHRAARGGGRRVQPHLCVRPPLPLQRARQGGARLLPQVGRRPGQQPRWGAGISMGGVQVSSPVGCSHQHGWGAGIRIGGAQARASVEVHGDMRGSDPRLRCTRPAPPRLYRRLEDGDMCNSTCCNNTASEHAMMLRLMVDDIVHWARDYKVGRH